MARYATISVPVEVKRLLERDKGSETWGSYLLRLYRQAKASRGERAFRELLKLLSREDLERIKGESSEFRRRFRLGELDDF